MPTLDAVYFVQASEESINKIVADMAGKSPLYKRAYVFVSSPLTSDLLGTIKGDKTVLPRLAALKEMNMEYVAVDSQVFVTDNSDAMVSLFGEHSEGSPAYEDCIRTAAKRLATVFASMQEFPLVRYKAPKPAEDDKLPTARDLAPTKLAAAVWDRLLKYKTSLINFPRTETCDLLILDRSVDLVAPFVHEWSYDAICHDLLNMEGNKYVVEATDSKAGRKEVLLEEHDPVWVELRHLHIAEATVKLSEKMAEFGSKNKAAQIRLGVKEGQELSTKDMQKLVQSLPQFREQLDKLSLHIQIATTINEKLAEQSLTDIAALEQDFAFGGGSSKDLVKLFNTKPNMSLENKLRLLMVYAVGHSDKLDAAKREQWKKLANLSEDDIHTIENLQYLGVPLLEKQTGGFFKSRKAPPARKDKGQQDATWDFSRFYPVIEDLIEELLKGELSKEEYLYVKEPKADSQASTPAKKFPHSVRTIRSTWATKHAEEGSTSDSATPGQAKVEGRRLFVFIIGGITRAEVKAAHKLTTKLKREVVLGSTSLNDPRHFVESVKALSKLEQLDIGDIEID